MAADYNLRYWRGTYNTRMAFSAMYVSRWLGAIYSLILLVASIHWTDNIVLNSSTLDRLYVFSMLCLQVWTFPPFACFLYNFAITNKQINVYLPIFQTSKFALWGIEGQVMSLAVHNLASIALLNLGRRFRFLNNFMYSSHLIYTFSTYFLSFWTGVLGFKQPIRIDYGKIQIFVLIYIITNELIRPFSNFAILWTHFIMFIHILERDIFMKQKEFSMNRGMFHFLYPERDNEKLWKLLETTVHAVF